MSDPKPNRPLIPTPPPPWLQPETHAAMRAAYDGEIAAGRTQAAAVAAACTVLLTQAAWLVRPQAEAPSSNVVDAATRSGAAPPHGVASSAQRLDEADAADLVAALSYALRFDARGRPRKGGWDHTADLAAEWLAEHLRRSHFVVLRRPPGAPHSAG